MGGTDGPGPGCRTPAGFTNPRPVSVDVVGRFLGAWALSAQARSLGQAQGPPVVHVGPGGPAFGQKGLEGTECLVRRQGLEP